MKAINAALLAFLFATACLGQDKKAAEYERQEQMWREQEERIAQINERLAQLQNPAPRFIDKFVGITGKSWAVSLVSEGGFFGFRTVAAINSDKKAYCGFDDKSLILADVPSEVFEKLQAFVEEPPIFESAEKNQIAGCKDCSTESLIVSVRSGGSITSRKYLVSDTSPVIFRVYEAMYDFSGCREKGN